MQRRADQIEELFLRFLLVLGALGRNVEHSNFSLCVWLQLQVVHRCVGKVNFLLKCRRLLLCLRYQHGHLTEDVSVHENQSDKHEEHDRDFR